MKSPEKRCNVLPRAGAQGGQPELFFQIEHGVT
jgi:hypothetical protein